MNMLNKLKLLFIGDIVGRPAREYLREILPSFKKEKGIDFVIANGENASGGSSIVPKNAEEILKAGVDVIIVAAGMDGALPSVVSGLVDIPVIGLPTSVGYGMGGKGEAALLAMLQTCSPGLAVVNIDNGVGAGTMAALIANRVAAARRAATREGK